MNTKNHNNFKKENFEEGVIFYTNNESKFMIFKIIRIDYELSIYHVKVYVEVLKLPSLEQIKDLEVSTHHVPIDMYGFEDPKFLTLSTVDDDDLLGYMEYIKQTENINEIIIYAKKYYQEGYQLSIQKKYHLAIKKYSITIDLIPTFFEAIDNRAFCKMDMGFFKEAIEDFNESLRVNPDSFLALFSIGECYFKLKEYPQSKEYFEKAFYIDPKNRFTNAYFKKISEMANL